MVGSESDLVGCLTTIWRTGTDTHGFVECRTWWDRRFARVAGVDTRSMDPDQAAELWAQGTEWERGNTVYRAERARRRDDMPPDGPWPPVFAVMGALADIHGGANVRLVV